MQQLLKILLLENEPQDVEIQIRFLKENELQFDYKVAEDRPTYLLALQHFKPDVILADHTLPLFNSVEALELMQQQLPGTVFILVTGTVSEEFTASIIKKGADDYILKDRLTRLPEAIKTALKYREAEKEKNKAQQLLATSEKQYRISLDRITDAFVALDSNWCYTYMNKKAGEIFQRNPVDMIGKHIWTEFPEGIDQSFYKAYYRAMAQQQYIHVEEYYPPYDKWFENHIYPSQEGLSIYFRDVTKKKKSDGELAKNEKRFRAMLENNPSSIALTDDALNSIYRSPSATHITGLTDEDIKTTSDINRIHPDDKIKMKTTVAEAIKNPGIPQPYLVRYLHKNGHYIWLEGKATKLTEENVLKGIVFNSSEVTERIELEQLLLKATRLARIGSWDVDLVKQTVYWNDITKEIHEAEKTFVPDLATGLSFYKEGPGRELITQKVKEAIELGKPWDEELEIVTAKNNVRWIRTIGETEFVDGKCVKIFGSFQDIDQQKKAEEQIKESEEKFRTLVQQAADGIFIVDMEGNYLEANESMAKITGYSIDELKKMNGSQLVEPEELKRNPLKLEEIKTGKPVYVERVIVKKDGTLRNVDISAKLMDNGKVISIMRDITERKEAEESLKKFNERFEMIARTTNDALWEWNLETGELWSNQMHQHLYDVDVSDPVPTEKAWLQKIHPADREKIITAKKNAYESDSKVWISEYRFETKNGFIDIYDRCYFIRNADGKVIRVTGTMIDITELKKAEKNFAESKNYLNTILETEPECVKVLNSKGELLSMNPAGLAMIEADNEQQVLGHGMTELVVEKYRSGFNRLTKQVFTGNSGTFEFEVIGLKGGHRWLETHAVPLKDAGGKIINLLGVTRDISQRKIAEKKIAASEIQYRRLFETAKDGILIIDADTGFIQDVNPYLMELLDYSHTEFMGKQIWEISLFKDIVANKESFSKLQKEGYVRYENLPLETRSGKAMWVEFISNTYPVNGKQIIQCNIRDMTDRKKAEDEILYTTDQLRQLTAHLQTIREEERKRIGREIHDELGQQLTAIRMDTVWIDRQIPAETTAIKEKIQNIMELLDGSNQAVRKILNELRPANLENQALTETMEWQGRQFTENVGIPVKFTSTETSLKLTEEAATCIFRVYQESLTNIMRYAAAKKVSVSLIPQGDDIILTVEDDGKGFDMLAVKNKKTFGLLGMKERVLSLNGKFDLVSSPGKGTKIVISLPYKKNK